MQIVLNDDKEEMMDNIVELPRSGHTIVNGYSSNKLKLYVKFAIV